MDEKSKQVRVRRFSKYDLLLFALFVLLIALFSGVSTNFLSLFNITTLMINFSILYMASLGGTLVIMVGGLDLSYSGVLTLSAIETALLVPVIGLWALPAGIVLGGAFGLANGLLAVKTRIPSFLVTLGTLYVSQGMSNLATPGGLAIRTHLMDFLLAEVVPGVNTFLIWALGLAALFYFISRYTAFGWRIYSTGSNELGSILNGVNVERIRILTFTLSGSLAGMTGALLLSYFSGASSSLGSSFVFIPLAVIVRGGTPLSGGVGGPHRTIVGALLIAVILDGLALSGQSPGVVTLFEGIAIILTTAVVSREIKLLVM